MSESDNQSIGSLVRTLESEYISGSTLHSKYVTTSLFDDVNKIYAYLESKHTTGETDALGRDKPFFNIVLAARNIWFRATAIKQKGIRMRATKSGDVFTSFMATAKFQEWARKEKFSRFLNDWGLNSAAFNESVLKFVEQDGRLVPKVVPWNRIISDAINFDDNPKIEVLELTEAQLYRNKDYDQKMVEALCDGVNARTTLEGTQKDNKTGYIKIYEIHGEFSQAVYNSAKGLDVEEGDDDIYFQQIHVISFVARNDSGYDDFTLYCGKEKDPYMLAALLPEVDGSVALRGAVKNLFDVQWMTNHTVKSIKDQLDLANKLIFQTSDGTFVGQNALSSIENGDILIHKVNEPLTQVNNSSHDISSTQNFNSLWKSLGNEINGISESMLGINPPSGTAWRQTEALLGESHSLFEEMTYNRKLDIEEMMRRFIIPFVKKQLDTTKEIATTLDGYGIDKIEETYLKNETVRRTNKKVISKILAEEDVTQEDQMMIAHNEKSALQDGLSSMGGQRFLKPSDLDDKTWKDVFKDFEWEADVEIDTGDVDKDAATTLNSLLNFFSRKQGQPLTPEERFTVNKTLMLTGAVSPIELPQEKPPMPNTIPAPGGGSAMVSGGLPVSK